ncbi:MAG: hypothetical protein IT342_17130 [Candidatus Melainabacteria bacterium]|nr:hypothetical protein [Candidatus Melainabacteria bacterium]
MNDSRDRKLGNGTSFRARLCPGLFPASSLIETAKGNQRNGDKGDEGGDEQIVAAYPTRLQSVHIGDMLVTA